MVAKIRTSHTAGKKHSPSSRKHSALGAAYLRAHFKNRASTEIHALTHFKKFRPALPVIKIAVTQKRNRSADLEAARTARAIGTQCPLSMGGSYSDVAAEHKKVRGEINLEANHTPPNASYTGTEYEKYSYGERPAHSMFYYHHRAPAGSTGSLTSTGGSGFNSRWAKELNALMKAGKFAEAMHKDFVDILNTTAPNRAYYALALHRAALYAHRIGLLDEAGFELVVTAYDSLLEGERRARAFEDAEVAMHD